MTVTLIRILGLTPDIPPLCGSRPDLSALVARGGD